MICNKCKIDKVEKDFINNQEFCYQCVYQIKLQKNTEKRIKKIPNCRICDKEIFHSINQIGRQRSVFCSPECAKKGHQKLIKEYWTRKIREVSYPYQKQTEE